MRIRAAALLIENQKILLLKYQYNGTVVYNLPGGKVDFGETMAATLSRELAEELNIETTVNELVILAQTKHEHNGETVLHGIFSTQIKPNYLPKINPAETKAIAAEWVPLQKLETIHLYPAVASGIVALAQNTATTPLYLGLVVQPWA
jgi:8-oxo-dGTP diphosphatase